MNQRTYEGCEYRDVVTFSNSTILKRERLPHVSLGHMLQRKLLKSHVKRTKAVATYQS